MLSVRFRPIADIRKLLQTIGMKREGNGDRRKSRVKWWRVLALGYLLSVPLPALILEAAGVALQYEHISFWVVQLYTFPLWIISEPLGAPRLVGIATLYWAAVALGIGVWLYRRGGPAS
jgi:hypothetical protein